jgi:hypothetical protein
MDKIGNYTGGEIISANMFSRNLYFSSAGGTLSYGTGSNSSPEHMYLFSGRCYQSNMPTGKGCGGVNLVHADNATDYRYFDCPVATYGRTQFVGTEVFGGNADNVNGSYVKRGLSDYAGSNILVPAQLYVPESTLVGADVRFRPIGYPAGARLVNMTGLDPGEAMTVGTDTWYCFPEFSKQTETTTPYGTYNADGFYYPYETSYMLGLAYAAE